MALIHLTVVTPMSREYDADAQRIVVRTTGGDVAILPHHIDYAALLGVGEARITEMDGRVRRAHVEGGVLHVAEEQVQVITNQFAWNDT